MLTSLLVNKKIHINTVNRASCNNLLKVRNILSFPTKTVQCQKSIRVVFGENDQ